MSKTAGKELSDVPILDETDYLHAAEAGNKFCQLVEEAMKNFKFSVEFALKERTDAKVSESKKEAVRSKPEVKVPLSETELIKAGFLIEKKNKKTGETSLAINGVSSGLKREDQESATLSKISCDQQEDDSSGSGKKKKKKKKKSKAKKGDSNQEDRLCGPPKPRNFLEAALYFSTITLGTVSMANQLDADVFFAPPLLFLTQPDEFEDIFRSRRIRSGPEYEGNKYLQRRISALFAVALTQSSPALRPFTAFDRASKGPGSSSAKTNYLKRSIGFFAVSLVDHLPPAMSNRLFKNGDSGPESTLSVQKSLGLDDLRVPSPEVLAEFWLSLPMEERLRLVQEEAMGLAKGWINPKKTWCMCKYCKHRRLRLSDIFDHTYRAYHEELVNFELSMKGIEPPAPTPHQVKVRKLLYKALSVVAEDILNTKSRLMLEAISRLSRVFHEDLVDPSMADCDGTAKCHCEDCAFFDGEGDYRDDDHDEDDDEDYDDNSDFDDLDIEEDGDFYEDYNYGEDDEYIQMESEIVIDEAQLPSTLPTFYDMDLLGEQPRILDHCAEGELLFQSFISQVFQFHLVPAYLESEALRKQQQLIAEEEEAARQAKIREEQKQLAKQLKRERQKAAKAATSSSTSVPAPEPVRAVEEAKPVVEAPKPVVIKEKKVKRTVVPEVIVPRTPIIHYDTSSFAVEDIREAFEEESHSKSRPTSAKTKKGKKKASTPVVDERPHFEADDKAAEKEEVPAVDEEARDANYEGEGEEPMPSWALEDLSETPGEIDMPPGLFGRSFFDPPVPKSPSFDDPPPPYSFFPASKSPEAVEEELEQDDVSLEDEEEEESVPPGLIPSAHRQYGYDQHQEQPYHHAQQQRAHQASRFEAIFNTKPETLYDPPADQYRRPFSRFSREEDEAYYPQPPSSSAASVFGFADQRTRPAYPPQPPPATNPYYQDPYQRQQYQHPDYEDYRQDYSRGATSAGRAAYDYGDDPSYYYSRPAPPAQDPHGLNPPGFGGPARPVRPAWRDQLEPSVAPGREGFNPFADWSPVKSSLFSTPLFPKPSRPKHNEDG